jgi:hypothetical protein
MLLIVLLGQLIGTFVASKALPLGVLADRPELGVLLVVLPGLVAGTGIGLLLRPERDRLLGYALVGAAVAVATWALLFGLAHLRAQRVPTGPVSAYLQGAFILVVAQTVAAVPLWWVRSRAAARSGNR